MRCQSKKEMGREKGFGLRRQRKRGKDQGEKGRNSAHEVQLQRRFCNLAESRLSCDGESGRSSDMS